MKDGRQPDTKANSTDETQLLKDLKTGNRRALAKVITLIESQRPDLRRRGNKLLLKLLPDAGRSLRVGISGSPGVGKSTFIEALGSILLSHSKRRAVLAIDPSSPVSGGSIMGDRTRMEELSSHPNAFIRPSPTAGTLGGVARRTRETIAVCEAAGYDVVIVETVGVGQSETMAASMVDVFLILQLPGAGDELQGIKKGILELADIIAVTKADKSNQSAAKRSKNQLERALKLTRGHGPWLPPVHLCSALEGSGINEIWESVETFVHLQHESSRFKLKRQDQAVEWFRYELGDMLRERITSRSQHRRLLEETEREVREGTLPASVAASRLLDALMESSGSERPQASPSK